MLIPNGFREERGSDEVGDSGDELGEGSVSDESNVEIVVVGDESADSNVDAESRRKIGDEKCELGEGLLATLGPRLDPITSAPCSRRTSVLSPYTDMNDGNGNDAKNDWELAAAGMLDSCGYVGKLSCQR